MRSIAAFVTVVKFGCIKIPSVCMPCRICVLLVLWFLCMGTECNWIAPKPSIIYMYVHVLAWNRIHQFTTLRVVDPGALAFWFPCPFGTGSCTLVVLPLQTQRVEAASFLRWWSPGLVLLIQTIFVLPWLCIPRAEDGLHYLPALRGPNPFQSE